MSEYRQLPGPPNYRCLPRAPDGLFYFKSIRSGFRGTWMVIDQTKPYAIPDILSERVERRLKERVEA